MFATMHKFCGQYKSISVRNKPIYDQYALISVSVDDSNALMTIDAKGYLASNNALIGGKVTTVCLNDGSCYFRWDGVFVQEMAGEGFFGNATKNAQTLKRDWNGNVRRDVYLNYWFRGPFGGFWFADVRDTHFWIRQRD